MGTHRRWTTQDEPGLTAETLDALFDNEIPAIRITDFATPEECAEVAAAMDRVGLNRQYTVPKLKDPPRFMGITQFEFRKKTRADYFAAVDGAWAEHDRMVSHCAFSPVERMMDRIRALRPGRSVTLMEEPELGRYYAGFIRETTGGGTLHADFARFQAPDYAIAANTAQVAWNFFVSEPSHGGVTTVHNAPFDPPVVDGQYAEIEPYDRALVAGAQTHQYKPAVGHAIMFNSRNPHEWTANVSGDGTRRMGVGTFIGRRPDGNLVYWS